MTSPDVELAEDGSEDLPADEEGETEEDRPDPPQWSRANTRYSLRKTIPPPDKLGLVWTKVRDNFLPQEGVMLQCDFIHTHNCIKIMIIHGVCEHA